jgi:hypothetical protein
VKAVVRGISSGNRTKCSGATGVRRHTDTHGQAEPHRACTTFVWGTTCVQALHQGTRLPIPRLVPQRAFLLGNHTLGSRQKKHVDRCVRKRIARQLIVLAGDEGVQPNVLPPLAGAGAGRRLAKPNIVPSSPVLAPAPPPTAWAPGEPK